MNPGCWWSSLMLWQKHLYKYFTMRRVGEITISGYKEWLRFLYPMFQTTSITHWDRETHICISKLCHLWFRLWQVTCSAPSHHLTQCWLRVNWNPGNEIQWNTNPNSNIFVQENAFENVVCEMAAISSRPQCDNHGHVIPWESSPHCSTVRRRWIYECIHIK